MTAEDGVAAELLHDLLDRRAASDPDAVAVSAAGGSVTYGQLREASRRLASWLITRGVRPRDRIAISLPVSVHVPALLFAVSRVGAAFCVLHEQVRDRALDHVLDDLEPVLLIGSDDDGVAAAKARGIAVESLADVADGAVTASPVELQAPSPRDVVCLIYTSGSTSRPKAVITEHRQLVFVARAIHERIGYTKGDTVFSALSLSFDYGLYQLFLTTLGGARLWWAAAEEGGGALLRALTGARATVLAAMPAMAETLVWLLERTTAPPSALRLLTTTGAAMKPQVAAALRQALPGLRLQIMYGLTECKRVSIMAPDEDLRHPGASGRPLSGTEVVVTGPDGELLAPGGFGEFVVRGPHVMSGYWRREDLTAERFRFAEDGTRELRTGDYGWIDEDGYLHVDGRRDDIYKERGFRVSTTEVEAAAHHLPGVRGAAVVPPGDTTGPHAVLVVAGPVKPRDVLRDLRKEIEPFKVPRECVVLDALPLSGNGKVARAELARLLADRADAT